MATELSCDTLGDLDSGIARAIINTEIKRAIADADDRGGEDGKARKVKIELSLVMSKGLLVVSVAAKAELPPYISNHTLGKVMERSTKAGGRTKLLLFQENSPENPEQPSFDMKDEGQEDAE